MANFGRRSEDPGRGPRLVVLGPQADAPEDPEAEAQERDAPLPVAAEPMQAPAPVAAAAIVPGGYSSWVHVTKAQLAPKVRERVPADELEQMSRATIANVVAAVADEHLTATG